MTRLGEIITAANDNRNDIEEIYGFVQGAQWADAHPIEVWHDVNEMPKDGEWILLQFDEDSFDTLVFCDMDEVTFYAWCKKYGAIRWAYITDLLPKGGER